VRRKKVFFFVYEISYLNIHTKKKTLKQKSFTQTFILKSTNQ